MNSQEGFHFQAMRNAISPAAAYSASHLGWRSPALYMFVGVAGMLVLIGFASLVLVCTWCRLASAQLGSDVQELSLESLESGPIKAEVARSDDEPEQDEKVLVIMPGDEQPSFLAKQLASVADPIAGRG